MPNKMTRERAIDRIEDLITKPLITIYTYFSCYQTLKDKENIRVIESLISTAKKVEEVVGEIQSQIHRLKSEISVDDLPFVRKEKEAFIAGLKYTFSLLTEEN